MTHERDDTRIIRSWLEEGVTALPDRVLDRVLDQLPATPQRRARRPAWRISMSTPIRLAAAAAALGILAVAGGIVPGTPGPGTLNLAASPSPSAAPSPLPAAIAPALVTGRLIWNGGAEFQGDAWNGATFEQRVRVRGASTHLSDARLNGKVTVSDDADRFFRVPGRDDDYLGDVLWGTVTIENDEGSWTGRLVGTTDLSADGGGISYIELTGEGAYEGLSAILFERELSQADWTWNGVIFDGPLPPDR